MFEVNIKKNVTENGTVRLKAWIVLLLLKKMYEINKVLYIHEGLKQTVSGWNIYTKFNVETSILWGETEVVNHCSETAYICIVITVYYICIV